MRVIDRQSDTAVITGAAHGIGAAFARQLAVMQKHLVLVDKDLAAMESMRESLTQSGAVEIELIAANLAQVQEQDRVVERLEQEQKLHLLINNAGFGDPKRFAQRDDQAHVEMLQVHVMAAVRFCRAALPRMLQSERGNIINVSSMAAELPLAGNVMYGSTKGFLRIFSEILRVECQPRGVNVQLLCPGYTRTEFHATPNYQNSKSVGVPGWLWSPPEAVAAASLRALAERKAVCVPGLWNGCMHSALRSRIVPKWLIRKVLA